jgi:DNA-binding NarL/FixJ family response regulator
MTIRIFLADDHAIIRDGLRALMEAHPEISVVGEAATSDATVELVQELQPDVVLMDISMPGCCSGIDATRFVLEKSPNTQVIILSMHGSPEHIFSALQAGVRGYLLKESAGREVIEAVQTVATGKNYFTDAIMDTLIADYLSYRQAAQEGGPLASLSDRELEILSLVAHGKTSAEIAEVLFLSPKTVETYRSRMMTKLGISDLAGLIKLAIQHGLIS